MSITFTVASETLKMVDGNVVTIYREIYPEGFDRTSHVDPEFPEYGLIAPENPWTANLCNSNALYVLETLGLKNDEDEYSGVLDPVKLLAACESCLGAIESFPELDGGSETTENGGNGCMTLINCGRRVGYLASRISELRDLAKIAIEHEGVISYA